MLIAVNPFQRLPLYTEAVMSDYMTTGWLRATSDDSAAPDALAPHVFRTADDAYRCMVDDDDESGGPVARNQSVLVSGESGAGKTETTKLVLRYLSALGRPAAHAGHGHGARPHIGGTPPASSSSRSASGGGSHPPSVEKAVLQSNPVLEALGNAKTTRNENSSRFGKFISMQFSQRGTLRGAGLQTYLLETVRVTRQSPGERNYHVFYQIHAGLPGHVREKLGLRGVETHAVTRESGTFTLRGEDDAAVFKETVSAMDTMGVTTRQQETLWRALAGLLHLGDVAFGPVEGGEGSALSPASADSAAMAAKLLGVEGGAEAMGEALTGKAIAVGRDTIRTDFSPAQAASAAQALIKSVYNTVFAWLVRRVNERIRAPALDDELFIGVLDIFGFEHFEHNSFEQLCINFANETLQQHFNGFMFKLEQEEYEREGIDWSGIDFADNQDCLDLIEGRKPAGLLALIDEQCRLRPKAPKPGDVRSEEQKAADLAGKLASKLNDSLGPRGAAHPRFGCTPRQLRDASFVVRHYAGEVEYGCGGFVEKNADEVHDEATALARRSTNTIVATAFAEADEAVRAAAEEAAAAAASSSSARGRGRAGKAASRETVGSQFRRQLAELMHVVRGTTPHYIRCIKPNSAQAPALLERTSVMQQLRCGGVLEAVRVARLGFPVRLPHARLLAAMAPALLPLRGEEGGGGEGGGGMSGPAADARISGLRLLVRRRAELQRAVARHGDDEDDEDDEDADGSGRAAGAAPPGSRVVDASGMYDPDADEERQEAAAESLRRADDEVRGATAELVADVARLCGADPASVQVGSTKTFFRRAAFDAMQRRVAAVTTARAVRLQAAWRRNRAKGLVRRMLRTIVRTQGAWRGFAARRVVAALRRRRAATRLQAAARMRAALRRFRGARGAALWAQSRWRGAVARRSVAELRRVVSSVRLQAWSRCLVARRRFRAQRRAAVSVQCFARQAAARDRLAELRRQAREVGSLRETSAVLRRRCAALEAAAAAMAGAMAGAIGAASGGGGGRIDWGQARLPSCPGLPESAMQDQAMAWAEAEAGRAAEEGREPLDPSRAVPSGFAYVSGGGAPSAVDAFKRLRQLAGAEPRAAEAESRAEEAESRAAEAESRAAASLSAPAVAVTASPSRASSSSSSSPAPKPRRPGPAPGTAPVDDETASLREQVAELRRRLAESERRGAAPGAAGRDLVRAPSDGGGADEGTGMTDDAADAAAADGAASSPASPGREAVAHEVGALRRALARARAEAAEAAARATRAEAAAAAGAALPPAPAAPTAPARHAVPPPAAAAGTITPVPSHAGAAAYARLAAELESAASDAEAWQSRAVRAERRAAELEAAVGAASAAARGRAGAGSDPTSAQYERVRAQLRDATRGQDRAERRLAESLGDAARAREAAGRAELASERLRSDLESLRRAVRSDAEAVREEYSSQVDDLSRELLRSKRARNEAREAAEAAAGARRSAEEALGAAAEALRASDAARRQALTDLQQERRRAKESQRKQRQVLSRAAAAEDRAGTAKERRDRAESDAAELRAALESALTRCAALESLLPRGRAGGGLAVSPAELGLGPAAAIDEGDESDASDASDASGGSTRTPRAAAAPAGAGAAGSGAAGSAAGVHADLLASSRKSGGGTSVASGSSSASRSRRSKQRQRQGVEKRRRREAEAARRRAEEEAEAARRRAEDASVPSGMVGSLTSMFASGMGFFTSSVAGGGAGGGTGAQGRTAGAAKR